MTADADSDRLLEAMDRHHRQDLPAARERYEQLVLRGGACSDAAAYQLGCLLLELREEDSALAALARAEQGNDPDIAAKAAYVRGHTFVARGELDEAEREYEIAMSSPDPELRARATVNRGDVWRGRGDAEQALRLYTEVIEGDQPEPRYQATLKAGAVRAGAEGVRSAHVRTDEAAPGTAAPARGGVAATRDRVTGQLPARDAETGRPDVQPGARPSRPERTRRWWRPRRSSS